MQEISFESTSPMSTAEFARWVEERASWDLNHYELLNGRVIMNPPASFPHGLIGARVVRLLGNHVHAKKLGEVLDSSQGFELPTGDTVEPDCAFVSRQRWQEAPEPQAGQFLRVVPDLIVEILSVSTASRDRGEKKAIYERSGVREYWLVDSRTRTLMVFHLQERRYGPGETYTEADQPRSKVFPELEFSVGSLF